METGNLIYTIVFYVFVAAYGLLVGSFLNVVIFRVPKEESVVKVRSHCMSCGYQLAWFDLVPVFSWLFLGGKCRKCKAKISAQYPIIEGTNAILCILIFLAAYGFSFINVFENFDPVTILYCLMASALLALSVIDLRTYIIPFGFNIFIFCLGVVNIIWRIVKIVVMEGGSFTEVGLTDYLIGFIAVSGFLGIIYFVSKGRAIGGGDIKLMAAAGLLIGWKLAVLALFLGCLLGSVIHIARMKITKADHMLAMGPYLSAGIMCSVLFGEKLINWYLGFFPKH